MSSSTSYYYQPSFACLVAETGGPKSKSSSAYQQRRAKISIDATNCSKQLKNDFPLFILKIEYHSTASLVSNSKNRVSNHTDPSQLLSTERKFAFQIGTSKLLWISSTGDDDPTSSTSFSSTSVHDNNYECSALFSKMKSLNHSDPQEGGEEGGDSSTTPTTTRNCIVTFERYLEARLFARQMHWLLEVKLPSRTPPPQNRIIQSSSNTASSIHTIPSSNYSLSPTTVSCALVALPIQWWFEGWSSMTTMATATSTSTNNNNTTTPSKGNNKNSTGDKNDHPLLSSNPALILTSQGLATTTWDVPSSNDEDDTRHQQQETTGGSNFPPTVVSTLYSKTVPSVLPLLESPKPTKSSELSSSSLDWAPCFSSSMLASSIEGSTVFFKNSNNKSSSNNINNYNYTYSTQPVPLHASSSDLRYEQTVKNRGASVFGSTATTRQDSDDSFSGATLTMSATSSFSVADILAVHQQQQQNDLMAVLRSTPHVSSKNVGSMNLVSTVNMDTITKKLFLCERSGGVNVNQLQVLSSTSTVKRTTRKCEFRSYNQDQGAENINFIAAPLQEAIVEASSVADNFTAAAAANHTEEKRLKSLFKNFFLGPNSTAICSSARVLCCVIPSLENQQQQMTYPIVYNATRKCLCVLTRSNNDDDDDDDKRYRHWATVLVEACFPFSFGDADSEVYDDVFSPHRRSKEERNDNDVFVPVLLFPTRHSPAFPLPSATISSSSNNFASSSLMLSCSSSPSELLTLSAASKDSSLHEILLVSALRSAILSYGLGPSSSLNFSGGSNALFTTSSSTSSHYQNKDKGSSTQHQQQQINILNILLNKPRSLNQLNISVVGAVGCGKSTLINALVRGQHQQQRHQTTSFFNQATSTMSEDLIFACSFDTFNGYSPVTNAVYSCCSASNRTAEEKYQKVQPVLVEAPAQSIPALHGTLASSDIIVCVVNCLLPHSLTWIEENVKPILDSQRTPILSVDAQGLHYARPNVVLVIVNSTSYRRTVTPEEISELASKLKNCMVADLEFGDGQHHQHQSNSNQNNDNNNNTLSRFSPDDAKIIASTLGKSVQCCAAYSRLLNAGWLPLHADWLILALSLTWERMFVKQNQQQQLAIAAAAGSTNSNQGSLEASATPRAGDDNNDDDNKTKTLNNKFSSTTGNGKSLLLRVLEDPVCVGLNEHIAQWLENDLLFTGGCPFSIYDCADLIALGSMSRDLRAHLIKLLCLKHCVQKDAVSKLIMSASTTSVFPEHDGGEENYNNEASSSSRYTTGRSDASGFVGSPTSVSSSSNVVTPRQEQDDQREQEKDSSIPQQLKQAAVSRSKKIAKKIYSLFSRKATKAETDPNNQNNNNNTSSNANVGMFSGESSYAIFQQEAAAINNMSSSASPSSSPSSAAKKDNLGLSASAILFLLSTYGVIVPSRWIYSLWGDVVSSSSSIITMRGKNSGNTNSTSSTSLVPMNQSLWLKFLNITNSTTRSSTSSSSRTHQQSVFTTKQLSQVDFGFVIFHWILELAKGSNSEFFSTMRSGWLSRPPDEFDDYDGTEISGDDNNKNKHSSDDEEDHVNPNSPTTTRPKKGQASSSFPSSNSNNKIPEVKCRSCGESRTNEQVVRCVICERKSCIIGDKRCTLFVGGREAEQRKQALLSVARTTGGATDPKTISMMLKQLPHVCHVCLMAHPAHHWQPDEEATTCYCCGVKFTLTRRRHHCRRDGNIVCGTCSKFEGPAFGYAAPQRMCIQCFDAPSPFVPLSSDEGGDHHHHHHQGQNNINRVAGTTRNNDDDYNHFFDENNQQQNAASASGLYSRNENDDDSTSISSEFSSTDDDDDEDHDENSHNNISTSFSRHGGRGGSDLESTTTLSRTLSRSMSREEDPRVVFAPWAHLVLNSEPDTVYRQPWYETLNEDVVGNVLNRIKHMIHEESEKRKSKNARNHHHHHWSRTTSIPRAEYVVRQPGYLEEADRELEDAAVGDDYPSEFDPDE